MAIFNDLLGTINSFFRVGLTGPRLTNSSGNLAIRNPGGTADAAVTASAVNVSGDALVLNSDAANTGADRSVTIARPATGMAASYTLTVPAGPGSPGQVMSTDGSGNTSWISTAGTADKQTVDVTSLAFGTASPLSLFTLPANAVVDTVQVVIDTAFNGTPSLSIGITGSTSKYMPSTAVDLTAAATTIFEVNPGILPVGTTEALIATYTGGGASAGAARILVSYSIPS